VSYWNPSCFICRYLQLGYRKRYNFSFACPPPCPSSQGSFQPRHQQDGGVSVSEVVRIPDLEPGGLAHPFELALNVPLAERPPALGAPRFDEQEIHLPSPARLQPLLFQGHHMRLIKAGRKARR